MKIDYSYVRSKRTQQIKKRTEYLKYKKELIVEEYSGATILPLKKAVGNEMAFGYGGVVDKDGNYIESSGISEDKIWGKYEFESPAVSSEKVVYLGAFIHHWGHFLVDSISRLWYYLQENTTVDKYIFFAGEGICPVLDGNYRCFLELLGILDKVEIITVPTRYNTVIIPEISYKRGNYFSKEYQEIIRRVIKNALSKEEYNTDNTNADKIFLSRSQIRPVTEFGLDMLDDFFRKNGYKIIYPETENLGQLVYLLDKAEEIVTMGGTCFFNTLFANSIKKIRIIERRVIPNQYEIDLLKILDVYAELIDADLPIYTIDDLGPFIIYYNKNVSRFCENNNMQKPDSRFYSERYLKNLLRSYLRFYRNRYGRNWFMHYGWYEKNIELFTEGYVDSYNYVGEYLSQKKPLFFTDYFNKKCLKSIVKKFIKKKS